MTRRIIFGGPAAVPPPLPAPSQGGNANAVSTAPNALKSAPPGDAFVASGTPGTITVGANVDVSNEKGPQSETDIAIDPTNPNHLLGGSNDIASANMRVYESFDGGKTWSNTALPLAPSPNNGFGSDPAVTFDTKGNAYYSFLGVSNSGSSTSLVCVKKPAGGTAWGQPVLIPATDPDKNLMTVDRNPASPHKDSLYVGWDNNNTNGSQALMLATSRDGGATFKAVKVNNAGNTVIGADPVVGPDGTVYVAWSNYASGQQKLFLNSSTDGGASFGKTDNLIHAWTAPTHGGLSLNIPADPQRGVTIFPFLDVDRSSGPNRGTVYCVYNDVAAGTTSGLNVYLQSSKDGGKTWSAPTQVNDDAAPGHDHFMPRVAVDDSDGSVNIAWYDTRNDSANKKTDVYFTRSADGGKTFAPNVRVTTAPSDETGAAPTGAGKKVADERRRKHIELFRDGRADANGYGDYIGIDAKGGQVDPLWTDSRTGEEEIETAKLSPEHPAAHAPARLVDAR